MPCDSSYMRASDLEVQLSRVACLLDELDGKPIDKSHWRGYHPAIYNRTSNVDADALVSRLCERLQSLDVTKYSLELQMWWRDHQAADKARVELELSMKKTQEEREAALAKLSAYERKLLGLGE